MALAPEVLSDRNYWSPDLAEQFKGESGVALLAPFKRKTHEKRPFRRV